MEHVILTAVEQLDDVAEPWDALCQQDDETPPTARASLVHLWYRHFAAGRCFRAVLVYDDVRLVGALPLIGHGRRGIIRWGMLPENHWAQHGTLLVDRAANHAQVARQMVKAFQELPWSLLWLRCLPLEKPTWRTLADTCAATGRRVLIDPMYEGGRIHLDVPLAEIEMRWSSNFRRRIRRALKHAEAEGGVELERFGELGEEDVEPWLREGFEIEDRSWKGVAGTSVLRTPRMFDFFLDQARQMARQKSLLLIFLRLGSRRIAFLYAWRVGQRHYLIKMGYDPQFRHLSPGVLLEYLNVRHLVGSGDSAVLDTAMGRLPDNDQHYGSKPYTVGSQLIPLRLPGSQILISGYRLRWIWKRLRKKRMVVPTEEES